MHSVWAMAGFELPESGYSQLLEFSAMTGRIKPWNRSNLPTYTSRSGGLISISEIAPTTGCDGAQEHSLTVSKRISDIRDRWRVQRPVRAFLEYSLVDFFPVYRDLTRCLDSDTYLITFYAQYCNGYIVTDDNFLTNTPCQNEHSNRPLVLDTSYVLSLDPAPPFQAGPLLT